MVNVTIQQSRKRFQALPKTLQEALFSVQTSEIVNRVAEQNSVTGAKVSGIAEATGLVILGFIHPEEVAVEIRERSGLDPQTAQVISASLNARIFSSLQKEIDLAYAPLPEEHYEATDGQAGGPGLNSVPFSKPSRIVEEIKQLKETGSELVDVLRKRETPPAQGFGELKEKAPIFPLGLK